MIAGGGFILNMASVKFILCVIIKLSCLSFCIDRVVCWCVSVSRWILRWKLCRRMSLSSVGRL